MGRGQGWGEELGETLQALLPALTPPGISLTLDNGTVVLEVVDDGVGYDTATSVGGLGLRNIRQRAFNAGARLDVVSTPGAGTRLQLRVPARTTVVI